jgi:UDP-N-acetylmuramoyl-tripeptide--D-alanyl-D-alanine ligase
MFKVDELLKATDGRLVRGKAATFIPGISIDSRSIKKKEAFIAIKGDNFDGHAFIIEAIKKGAGCVIYSSSFARQNTFLVKRRQRYAIGDTQYAIGDTAFIEVKDTVRALGDIARFKREKFNHVPLIGITGSNGKTTAKEMAAWVLSARFKVLKNEGTKNNQIGVPLTLLNLNDDHELAVLELGTNHFGEISYLAKICAPNVGVIINIGPSHLEFLHSLQGVFREKYSLFKHLKSPYLGIVNADDRILKRSLLEKSVRPFILGCAMMQAADFFASGIKRQNNRIEFLVNSRSAFKKNINKNNYKIALRTLGYYNIHNALIAIAIARIFGMTYGDIVSRLADFDFPQGRLNLVNLHQTRFIDDTYNSNPLSLQQALAALNQFKTRGRKIFVMGDMLELGKDAQRFHYQAVRSAARVCDVFIAVGGLSKLATQSAKKYFRSKDIFICASMARAREVLFNDISPKKNDIVLVKGSRAMKMEEIFRSK